MIAPPSNPPFPAVVLAREAMATRFEIVLPGTEAVRLRAAGEAALDEIERLEGALSLYRPTSEIARVNARAALEPVRLSPPVFRLLEQAKALHRETQGAFDITIAPLVRCWGFMRGSGAVPAETELAAARACVGMELVELEPASCAVRFRRPGVMLDLGGIGKGYALDCAVEVLRESGITSALIHGGTSSIYGLGHPPDGKAWKVAVEGRVPGSAARPVPLAIVPLCNASLSVSAVWGKMFTAGDKPYGHVLDPRTGRPTEGAWLAAAVSPTATDGDALTTALLVDGAAGQDRLAATRPDLPTVLALPGPPPAGLQARAFRLPLLPGSVQA